MRAREREERGGRWGREGEREREGAKEARERENEVRERHGERERREKARDGRRDRSVIRGVVHGVGSLAGPRTKVKVSAVAQSAMES